MNHRVISNFLIFLIQGKNVQAQSTKPPSNNIKNALTFRVNEDFFKDADFSLFELIFKIYVYFNVFVKNLILEHLLCSLLPNPQELR